MSDDPDLKIVPNLYLSSAIKLMVRLLTTADGEYASLRPPLSSPPLSRTRIRVQAGVPLAALVSSPPAPRTLGPASLHLGVPFRPSPETIAFFFHQVDL